jgi:NAD(P)-dependent dehydrogenase (short-subunit alcohol dehydrogenase family)
MNSLATASVSGENETWEIAMHGKVVVITGATAGIGQFAAEHLAKLGARLVLIARDRNRAEATLSRLRAIAPNAGHRACFADLSLMADVKRVAAEIAAAEPRIDVLINNAGGFFASRKITEEGLERTFALNHMAYFVLTQGLRERLIASAPARIVNMGSVAHLPRSIDFDDLQTSKRYELFRAYGRSKLYNILFTRELARRLAGTGVTANCVDPGIVATNLGQREGGVLGVLMGFAMLFAGRPERAVDTIAYLAGSPELADVTGKYYFARRPAVQSRRAQDDAAAARLWLESERIARRCTAPMEASMVGDMDAVLHTGGDGSVAVPAG